MKRKLHVIILLLLANIVISQNYTYTSKCLKDDCLPTFLCGSRLLQTELINDSDSANLVPQSAFCDPIENNIFVDFSPCEARSVIELCVSNCTLSKGIYAAVFGVSNCQVYSSLSSCEMILEGACRTIVINAPPESRVTLMIDGIDGDVCSTIFNVIEGFDLEIEHTRKVLIEPAKIEGPTSLCPGELANYQFIPAICDEIPDTTCSIKCPSLDLTDCSKVWTQYVKRTRCWSTKQGKGRFVNNDSCSNNVQVVWIKKGDDTLFTFIKEELVWDSILICSCDVSCCTEELCEDEAELPVTINCDQVEFDANANLHTNDRVCPCGEFEVFFSGYNFGSNYDVRYHWTIDGIPQTGSPTYRRIKVSEFATPGSRIEVCVGVEIIDNSPTNCYCGSFRHCVDFIVEPIDLEIEDCEVVCFEDRPYVWQGIPITSSCIVPPCSTRIIGPDNCCVDILKAIVLLPPSQIGRKDTLVCQPGYTYTAEDGITYSAPVCDELIQFKKRAIHPACPTSIQECDTSYQLNIETLKFTSNPEFDCTTCSGEVNLRANVDYEPSCPNFNRSVSIVLNWYDQLSGNSLGRTDAYGSVICPGSGVICAEIEARINGNTCSVHPPICFKIPKELYPEKPKIKGDTIACGENIGRYITDEIPNRCEFIWRVERGGGVILGNNTLDSSSIHIDWSNRTDSIGVICLEILTDCGRADSCLTISFTSNLNPHAGPDQVVCGLQTTLEGHADKGIHNWQQISGPEKAIIEYSNDLISKVITTLYGKYSFELSEETADCEGKDTVTINFVRPPEISSLDTICDPNEKKIKIDINISHAQLPLTTNVGQLSVNDSLISGQLEPDSSYLIKITDANGCEVELSIQIDCACTNNFGDLSVNDHIICGHGKVDLNYDINRDQKGLDQELIFALLSNPIFDMNDTIVTTSGMSFEFDETIMDYGQTYFIFVLHVNTDELDWKNDKCFDYGLPVEVIWYEEVKAPEQNEIVLDCNRMEDTLFLSKSYEGLNYYWIKEGDTIGHSSEIIVASEGQITLHYNYGLGHCHDSITYDISLDTISPEAKFSVNYDSVCAYGIALLIAEYEGDLEIEWITPLGKRNTDSIRTDSAGLYILEVYNKNNGCYKSYSQLIDLPSEPLIPHIAVDTPSCPGELYFLQVKPFHHTALEWGRVNQDSFTSEYAEYVDPGVYEVEMEDIYGCKVDTSIELVELDTLIIGGNDLTRTWKKNPHERMQNFLDSLRRVYGSEYSIELSDLNGEVINDIESLEFTKGLKEFLIKLTNNDGCDFEVRLKIFVEIVERIFIPNVITPNDDGSNDAFHLFLNAKSPMDVLSVSIYDRWGELVYRYDQVVEFDQYGQSIPLWDGYFLGEMMFGAFVYVVHTESPISGAQVFAGSLTVVR